jgi:hypothetical protein
MFGIVYEIKSKTSSCCPTFGFDKVDVERVYTKNKDIQEAKHKHTTYLSQAVPRLLYCQTSARHQRLARSRRRHIQALRALGATSNAVTAPSPVRASTLSAQNVHLHTLRRNSTSNTLDSQTSDRNTVSRGTSRAAVLIVLLNNNTVLGNVRELDVLVGDAANRTSSTGYSLDSHTVVGVGNGRREDLDVLDDVVGAAADGTDADAVAAGAGAAGESDVGTGVDCKAVILVLDVGVGYGDTSGAADVEGVGVVATVGHVTSGVVDGDVVEREVGGTVNGEALDRCVLDVEVIDVGGLHGMCVEELLRSATDKSDVCICLPWAWSCLHCYPFHPTIWHQQRQ